MAENNVQLVFKLPYHQFLERSGSCFVYYGNARGVPEVSGGRVPADANLLSIDEMLQVIERLGPRFDWVANGTAAFISETVRNLVRRINANQAGIIVSSLEFAKQLRLEFPDLRLIASCIMALYHPLKEIIDSGLFVRVVTPQFWNYDFDALGKLESKHLQETIVNSKCDHRQNIERCRRHYDDCSSAYDECKSINGDWKEQCDLYKYLILCQDKRRSRLDGKCELRAEIEDYGNYRSSYYPSWNRVVEELVVRGFSHFKFQGRAYFGHKEWAEHIVNEIEYCIPKWTTLFRRSEPKGGRE